MDPTSEAIVAVDEEEVEAPIGDEEDSLDSFQVLFQEIVEAQSALGSMKKPEQVSKHLLEVTYPLMSRMLGLTVDMRDMIREIADDVSGGDSAGVSEDDSTFLFGFFDSVLAFVAKYGAGARQEASSGRPELLEELTALYMAAVASKKIVQGLVDNNPLDGIEVDDVEDENE